MWGGAEDGESGGFRFNFGGDADAAAVLRGLASCASLRKLELFYCESLTALPDLSGLVSLQTLRVGGCTSLTAMPALPASPSLEIDTEEEEEGEDF